MKKNILLLVLAFLISINIGSAQSKAELQKLVFQFQNTNSDLRKENTLLKDSIWELNQRMAVLLRTQQTSQSALNDSLALRKKRVELQKSPMPSTQTKDSPKKESSTHKATNSSTQSSSSKTIYTGPRGGRYYLNSKGNKVYIKQ